MKLLVASSVFAVYFASASLNNCAQSDWTDAPSTNFFTTECTDLVDGASGCTLVVSNGYEGGSVSCDTGIYIATVATLKECGSADDAGSAQVIADGCGCAAADKAITAVTADATKAYCAACGTALYRAGDAVPVFALQACHVLQCGTNAAAGVLKSEGCGCPADYEVKEAQTANHIYCDPCAAGDSRPMDSALVSATAACTAVVGKCSGNKVSADNLATGAGATYGFDCGTDGYTVKSKAFALSGTDAAARKVACCTVLQCGTADTNDGSKPLNPGCGCALDQAITARAANAAQAYCTACPNGFTRDADTSPSTAVALCTAVKQCGSANDATGQVIAKGCGCAADKAITIVTDHATKAYCKACGDGYFRTVDTTPKTAFAACAVKQCGSANDATAQVIADGCGCAADKAITAVTADVTKAYCAACGTNLYRAEDTVPVFAVKACNVLQCGTDAAAGVLKTSGCGCPADHEVKEATTTTKLYCDPCAAGDSRPMDSALVLAPAACTAVVGKCSGNKVSAVNLATGAGTPVTYGFDCGTGYTVKSKASALSGTDAAARKVACCTVTQCGLSPGILKTATCGCATNEEIKESTDTTKLYCAACPTGKVRPVSTTAVAIAELCTVPSAPTPTVAPTSNSTTAPTNASTVVTIIVSSKVTFDDKLSDEQSILVTASYCKAVGPVDDNKPKCSIKSLTRRRLLAESTSYLLTATFSVNTSATSDFTKKAIAKQEAAKADFLNDADVLKANGGKAPTYTSNTVTIDGKDVTTAAPTDDDNEIDFSGSSALAVSFGVICSMLL